VQRHAETISPRSVGQVEPATSVAPDRLRWLRAVERTRVSPGARLVAGFIARMPSFPHAFPELRTLAEVTGRSVVQTRRYVRELERVALLGRARHIHERLGQRANDLTALLPERMIRGVVAGDSPSYSEKSFSRAAPSSRNYRTAEHHSRGEASQADLAPWPTDAEAPGGDDEQFSSFEIEDSRPELRKREVGQRPAPEPIRLVRAADAPGVNETAWGRSQSPAAARGPERPPAPVIPLRGPRPAPREPAPDDPELLALLAQAEARYTPDETRDVRRVLREQAAPLEVALLALAALLAARPDSPGGMLRTLVRQAAAGELPPKALVRWREAQQLAARVAARKAARLEADRQHRESYQPRPRTVAPPPPRQLDDETLALIEQTRARLERGVKSHP
jgi:hypothetical protein